MYEVVYFGNSDHDLSVAKCPVRLSLLNYTQIKN